MLQEEGGKGCATRTRGLTIEKCVWRLRSPNSATTRRDCSYRVGSSLKAKRPATLSIPLASGGDQRGETIWIDRLHEMRVKARVHGPSVILRLPVAGDGHEEDVPAFVAASDVPRQLVAIPPRQADVHEGQVRTPLGQARERFLGITLLLHLVPPQAQHAA